MKNKLEFIGAIEDVARGLALAEEGKRAGARNARLKLEEAVQILNEADEWPEIPDPLPNSKPENN